MKTINNLFKSKIVKRLSQLVLFLFAWLYLSNFASQQNNAPVFDYRSEVFADKSGYYCFLPAVFIYNFKAENFPKDVDLKTGNGFYLGKKIETKYTCGTAILASPFFLVTHWYQTFVGNENNGFTKPYFVSLNYCAVFYLLLGLVFLYNYLKFRIHPIAAFITIVILFLASNLFYYSLVETFMTHVYSFFLFSLLLFAREKYIHTRTYFFFFLLALASGFLVLIRPTNILFLLIVLFLKSNKKELTLWEEIKIILTKRNIISGCIIVVLLLFPQLLYNNYLNGSPFQYSYKNEGFPYLLAPKFLDVLFNPINGLLIYVPVYILLLITILIALFKNKNAGWIALISFLLMLYICGSWHAYFWGCGFGQRNFVEILPILIIPFALFIDFLRQKSYWLILLILIPISYLSILNISLARIYDRCFQGNSWVWREYHKVLIRTDIYPFNTQSYKNHFLKEELGQVRIKTLSGLYVTIGDDRKLLLSSNKTDKTKFFKVKNVDNLFGFKTIDSYYVSSDNNLNGLCIADRTEQNAWEKFRLFEVENGKIKLQNSEGFFIRIEIDKWGEKFLIADKVVDDSTIFFKFENW